MLVGAFEIHDLIAATINLALGARKAREMFGIFERVSMRRA